MKKLSFEYCHVSPSWDNKEEIEKSNYWTPRVLKAFEGWEIQKCIMVDDIHTDLPVDEKFIKSIVSKLKLKPDCIYLESEFVFEASEMVKKIDPKERDFIQSNERTWLRENVEKYRSVTEFLLSWKDSKGKIKFSCPALASASYLTRLGLIKGDGVNHLYGKKLMIGDQVLNLLSSKYLQVEDKAQSVVEATFKDALRKISWFFY